MNNPKAIVVRDARHNNLQGLDAEIPHHALTVITGPSGSGKSSLAFDTLYAEGQRRYVETFSPYTRQFLERMDKPEAGSITGIPPAVAIEQANHIRTSRSTVGTLTELGDYLKVLFHRAALPHCPKCGEPVRAWDAGSIAAHLAAEADGGPAIIAFEMPLAKKTPAGEIAAFIAAQGYRRVILGGRAVRLDEHPATDKISGPVVVVQDRIQPSPSTRPRLAEALETALRLGKGCALVYREEDGLATGPRRFSLKLSCGCGGGEIAPKTPSLFSFNNPVGACPTCKGFGRSIGIDLDLVIPDPSLSLADGAVKPWRTGISRECQTDLLRSCKKLGIPTDVPFKKLTRSQRSLVVDGEPHGEDIDDAWAKGYWYGVRGFFQYLEKRTYKMHVRVFLSRYRSYQICDGCGGRRFRPETLLWKLGGLSLPEFNAMPAADALSWFEACGGGWMAAKETAVPANEIRARLGYLVGVGLGYLTLDRAARTLSGGELQRVNLASCLGTSLVNTLFVLDEPSIGLHPRDTGLLIGTAEKLRDAGNTIVVVEHDRDMMLAADHILEIGPGRGAAGGKLVFSGPPKKLLADKNSLTAKYLTGALACAAPPKPREAAKRFLEISGASEHNLKNISLRIPLGRFVCFTGVSGSGKSTLVLDCLYKNILRARGLPTEEPGAIAGLAGISNFNEVILADQSPLSRTPRSNPILHVGAYDAVREIFAGTDDAKKAGLTASSFSFNGGDGRCERCAGMGWEKVEMQFLTDLFVTCPVCSGARFQSHVLEARYHGKTIADLLATTVDDAAEFFAARAEDGVTLREKACASAIASSLQWLRDVGLGYITLGQPLNQLSGGESQRIKLAGRLNTSIPKKKKRPAPTAGGDLIILDEPTTGLHFDDIRMLLSLLRKLVDAGHSLLVIEHHPDVIRSADWVVDLGPEGGAGGGMVVCEGVPDEIAACPASHTGRYLSPATAPAHEAQTTKTRRHGPASIEVEGARHHNLKNLTVSIPLGGTTVLTGLSGSGKSTLAFDIIFAEGQRRYLDSLNAYARQFAQQFEKPDVDRVSGIPPTVAIEQHTTRGGGKSTVGTVTEIHHFLRLLFAKLGAQHDPDSGEPAIRQSAQDIGRRIRSLATKSKQGVTLLAPLIRGRKGFHTEVARWAQKRGYALLRVDGAWIEPAAFKPLARYNEHSIEVVTGSVAPKSTPGDVARLVRETLDIGKGTLLCTADEQSFTVMSTRWFAPGTGRSFDELDPRVFSYNSPHGWCPECHGYGTVARLALDGDTAVELEIDMERKREMLEAGETAPCTACGGHRLNPIARAVRFCGLTIGAVSSMSAEEALAFFKGVSLSGHEAAIARDIVPEIMQRLDFLRQVGLGYLQLERSAKTLSGGESQRIRLASQLGSNLEGVLYVLDEPTIGLHPRDNEQLLAILDRLKSRGNSLLMVEHDEDTMRRADHIIDLGPGAGIHGGEVVAEGHWKKLTANSASITGQWLGTPIPHPMRGQRRETAHLPRVEVRGGRANNIRGLDIALPLGCLIVLTGVSGSGKSTLMHDILRPAITGRIARRRSQIAAAQTGAWQTVSIGGPVSQIIEVDQAPIGKTSRSTPATYTGLFDELRQWFAMLPEARARGYAPGRFSYNSGKGRCSACQGTGQTQIAMDFLPSVKIPCETCGGRRYNDETLGILYKGRSIADCLAMSVEEASLFFDAHPKIGRMLDLLKKTGLGYLTLGQSSPTLSGGEAQRLKLVTELAKGGSGHGIYLLEEPSIGLHTADVRQLLDLLHQLVDSGNTVITIEHHLDIIAEADWVVDMGPEAGAGGGHIVFEGTPEGLLRCHASHTARYLAPVLNAKPAAAKRRTKKI